MAEPTPVPSRKPTFPARLLPLECAFVILMWIHPDNRILTGLTILAAACLCGFLFQFRLMDFRHGRWCSRLVHLAAICSFIVALLPCKPFLAGPTYDVPELSRPDVFAHRRVMIIAPHQDDELILLCGVLEEYIRHGSEVHVVFVTNGDFYGLGPKRINEALRVLTKLGIPRKHIVFLGYGDQWKAPCKHIYHAPDNEILTSRLGRKQTYATPQTPPWRCCDYTRANLLADLTSVLDQYKPDTIFTVDYDSHCDHRATSLMLDEVLAQRLPLLPAWRPDVYKGFAYSLGWFGVDDYYSTNIHSSVKPTPGDPMNETGVFLWSRRVRFPVSPDGLARTLFNSRAFVSFSGYASQDTMARSGRIVNGDRVFWFRPTTNVLYNAQISTTSGTASCLNDFKLFDSSDITKSRRKPDRGVWIPDANDAKKTITIRLPEPTSLEMITLYDHPSPTDNVLAATILFDDGSFVRTGKLNPSGAATSVSFQPRTVRSFSVQLIQGEGSCFGLTELEAFEKIPEPKITVAKLINRQGDFLYDYIMDSSGTETFELYCSGQVKAESLIPYTDNPLCRFERHRNRFIAHCPCGTSCVVTLQSPDGKIFEQVRLRNPSRWERINLVARQKLESTRFHLNFCCQAEYYAEWGGWLAGK